MTKQTRVWVSAKMSLDDLSDIFAYNTNESDALEFILLIDHKRDSWEFTKSLYNAIREVMVHYNEEEE